MNVHAPLAGPLRSPAALDILGVPVVELGWHEAIAFLARRLEAGVFTPVGFLNAHNSNVAARDPAFAAALARFTVLPDGVGVDIAARALHGRPFPANLNGTDFVPALIHAIRRPLRVALLGATRENAGGAAKALAAGSPWHDVRVIHDGYFAAADEPGILARIREFRPDIMLVAMGVPRQEFWIARNLSGELCTMPVAVGALLDFLSGSVPRAPQWMRDARLEWLFRLWIEPGRLWRRYIVGNPLFLARLAGARLAGLFGR